MILVEDNGVPQYSRINWRNSNPNAMACLSDINKTVADTFNVTPM